MLGNSTVQKDGSDFTDDFSNKPFPQTANVVGSVFIQRKSQRVSQHFSAEDVFRAGAETVFLMTAEQKRSKLVPFAHIENARALRPAELMPGQGKVINAQSLNVDGKEPCGLHGVGMKQNAVCFRNLRQFSNWLDGADLVIDVHDGDEPGMGLDGVFQNVRRYGTDGVDGQIGDFAAHAFHVLAGIENGGMLDAAGDDVISRLDRPLNNPIIAFRSAGGEVDFAGACVQAACYFGAGFFQRLARLTAFVVDGTGVCVKVEMSGRIVHVDFFQGCFPPSMTFHQEGFFGLDGASFRNSPVLVFWHPRQ